MKHSYLILVQQFLGNIVTGKGLNLDFNDCINEDFKEDSPLFCTYQFSEKPCFYNNFYDYLHVHCANQGYSDPNPNVDLYDNYPDDDTDKTVPCLENG